jgi:hypothetical protein
MAGHLPPDIWWSPLTGPDRVYCGFHLPLVSCISILALISSEVGSVLAWWISIWEMRVLLIIGLYFDFHILWLFCIMSSSLPVVATRRSKYAIIIHLLGSNQAVHNSQLNLINQSINPIPHLTTVVMWQSVTNPLLVIGFTEHLYTQLVTTSNCSTIANLRTLQFITAHTTSSQSAASALVVTW